jgi:SAM-dependent methyltransferase
MGAQTDQTAFWDQKTNTSFTHSLDVARFERTVPRDARILDYGCGQGRLCGELLALGYPQVTGIDSSAEMLRVARAAHPGAQYLHSDGLAVPLPDSSCDVVLLFAVLTCIPDDRAQQDLVADFKRVLRPGGLMIVSDYPLQDDARNRERYQRFAHERGGYGTFRLPDGVVLRHHRREWFDELLAGFAIEEAVERDALTMNGNPARIVQRWLRRGTR